MFGLAVMAVGLAVSVGLLVKFLLAKSSRENYRRSRRAISWLEIVMVSAVMACIVAPGASALGTKISVSEQLQYVQALNGVETEAIDSVTTCYAGHADSSSSTAGQSNCDYTYRSGSYTYYWTEYVESCTTDSKGNRSCVSIPVQRSDTAYIYTPYASQEHHYTIKSWMYDGDGGQMSYTFPTTYLDENPVRHKDSDQGIPGNLPKGAPADWQDAKNRLDAGDPRAVTEWATYDNYILASKDDVLKTYGARLDEYKAAGLLPEHTANINSDPVTGPSRSQSDKVSFVGVDAKGKDAWQKSVMRFNAAFGTQLQGDLHVVLIDANTVPGSDAVPYTQSLKAYWQSDAFGRRAIAKNAVILVVGVDKATNTVAWADASTGMPFGNELMIQYLRDNLPGTALEPTALFGTPRTVVSNNKANVTHPSPRGAVESIVFEQAPFKRFSMSCDNESCIGYKDLASKIKPTGAAKAGVVAATIFISLILWVIVALTGFIDDFGRWVKRTILPHPKGGQASKTTPADSRSWSVYPSSDRNRKRYYR